MSKRMSGDSVENVAQGGCGAPVDIQPPCLPGTTSIEKLPIELRERIFEFVGDIAYVSGRDRVDFPDDETPYPYIPPERHLDVPCRPNPTPYDYLRSSSLASRAFTAPAQRALFRVSMTRSSIGMLRLLRSLLEYPANRKYVQWLVTSPLPGENILDRHVRRQNPPDVVDPISALVKTLGPLFHTPALDQLQNAAFFRRVLLPFVSKSPDSVSSDAAATDRQMTEMLRQPSYILGDHILRAILELCPQIRGARLFDRNTWIDGVRASLVSEAFSYVPNGLLGQDCPRLKSLTLDIGTLKWCLLPLHNLHKWVPGYRGGCPPTVEYLKIVGKDPCGGFEIHLDDLYEWLSTNKKLRELRMLQEFCWYPGFGGFEYNWNTILPMFKDTLEVLVLDGNRYFEGAYYLGNRFGWPSGMLDCLPQLKKLAYLEVPLHYLRDDMPKFEPVTEDLGLVVLPDGSAMDMSDHVNERRLMRSYEQEYDEPGNRPSWHRELLGIRILKPGEEQNILGLIQAELPPSLRKLRVGFVKPSTEEDEDYGWWFKDFSFQMQRHPTLGRYASAEVACVDSGRRLEQATPPQKKTYPRLNL